MDEKTKKLKKMATWTIAVFATVFALATAAVWLVKFPTTGGSRWTVLGAVLASSWLIYLVAAVLCVAAYFGYGFYLNRKK
ncbi:MAG TPA: hypothetical protein VMC09_11795 [Anaerolineales bacterium]|nr:hypothetical protein [Anaerolineales bacterium]